MDYCSRRCQRRDWTRHRRLCAPVVFKQLDTIGRGLVATKNIKKGDLIFIDKAFISINRDTDEVSSDINDENELERFEKLKKIVDDKSKKRHQELASIIEENVLDWKKQRRFYMEGIVLVLIKSTSR